MLALSLATLLLIGSPLQAVGTSDQDTSPSAASAGPAKPNPSTMQAVPPSSDPAASPAQSSFSTQRGSLEAGQMTESGQTAQTLLVQLPKTLTPEVQKKIAEMQAKNEPHRLAAIRINEMAGNIHSEKDARAVVDAIAEELTNHRHLMWAALTYRRRVAQAEFRAVSDPAKLISDQRIADVWNEYVREIDAPEETLIGQEEVERMRRGRLRMSQFMWRQENARSIWNMPNVHAVNGDGSAADGGRPLEMLDILNALYRNFPGVLFARERKRELEAKPEVAVVLRESAKKATSNLKFITMPPDPVHPAETRYVQAHGEEQYDQLVRRLFDELFPLE